METEKTKKPKVTEAYGFVGGNLLRDILAKGPDGITEDEKAVLEARRSYLTKAQREEFGITGKVAKKKTDKEETSEGSEESAKAPETPPSLPLEDMNLKALRKLAKEKKVKIKRGAKEADIIKSLKEADKKKDE